MQIKNFKKNVPETWLKLQISQELYEKFSKISEYPIRIGIYKFFNTGAKKS